MTTRKQHRRIKLFDFLAVVREVLTWRDWVLVAFWLGTAAIVVWSAGVALDHL